MYICISVFPYLLGGFLHIIICICNYMLWPLVPGNTTCLFLTWYQSRFRFSASDRRRQFAPASSPVPVLAAAVVLAAPSPSVWHRLRFPRWCRSAPSSVWCRSAASASSRSARPICSSICSAGSLLDPLGRPAARESPSLEVLVRIESICRWSAPTLNPPSAARIGPDRPAAPGSTSCARSRISQLRPDRPASSGPRQVLVPFVPPPRPPPGFTGFSRRSPEKVAAGGDRLVPPGIGRRCRPSANFCRTSSSWLACCLFLIQIQFV
jgi:hypothetical protein